MKSTRVESWRDGDREGNRGRETDIMILFENMVSVMLESCPLPTSHYPTKPTNTFVFLLKPM